MGNSCQKPNSDTELVIHMTENNPCSIDFSEFNNSFVTLLLISYLDFLSKKLNKNLLLTMEITFGGKMV